MISEISDDKKRDPRMLVLLERLHGGATLEEAAFAAGVSSRMVRYWREKDEELESLVQEAMAKIDDQVEAMTLANCLDPDPAHNTLRMFWLKNRRRDVFGEKIQTDHTNAGQPFATPITIVEVPGAGHSPPVPDA